jgi:UDPglucose 6-dehydrogenase
MTGGLNVGVVGAGYVGLVTAACLAHVGHRVTCLERDEERLAGLRDGRMPVYEPGLDDLVARRMRGGWLSFAGPEGLLELVRRVAVVFIAVDTLQGEDGSADLSSVATVARTIGRALAEASLDKAPPREYPLVVVNKSTVPVGSGDYVSMLIRESAAEAGEDASAGAAPLASAFRVVSNPEFLREGAPSTTLCSQTGSWSGPTPASLWTP